MTKNGFENADMIHCMIDNIGQLSPSFLDICDLGQEKGSLVANLLKFIFRKWKRSASQAKSLNTLQSGQKFNIFGPQFIQFFLR